MVFVDGANLARDRVHKVHDHMDVAVIGVVMADQIILMIFKPETLHRIVRGCLTSAPMGPNSGIC